MIVVSRCFVIRLLCSLAIVPGVLTAASGPGRATEPPAVVASILPVQGLVSAVMDGVATPRLLVPAGGSPHAYNLKPSDAAALSGADLIVWVGPALETFLTGSMKTLPDGARILTLAEVPGTIRHDRRHGVLWDEAEDHDHDRAHEGEHDHDHEDNHDHDHDHDAAHEHEHSHVHVGNTDPHMWLDPRNAIVWTAAIAEALTTADPDHAALYRRNAEAQKARLRDLDAALAQDLSGLGDRPYLVFHDAYRYLEERYGLHSAGALSLAPGQPVGARHMAELRQRVETAGIRCIFGEPQVSDQLAKRLADGTGAGVDILNPLGEDAGGKGADYPDLMRAVADGLKRCLTRE